MSKKKGNKAPERPSNKTPESNTPGEDEFEFITDLESFQTAIANTRAKYKSIEDQQDDQWRGRRFCQWQQRPGEKPPVLSDLTKSKSSFLYAKVTAQNGKGKTITERVPLTPTTSTKVRARLNNGFNRTDVLPKVNQAIEYTATIQETIKQTPKQLSQIDAMFREAPPRGMQTGNSEKTKEELRLARKALGKIDDKLDTAQLRINELNGPKYSWLA